MRTSCGYVERHYYLLTCPCASHAIIKSEWFASLKTFLYNPSYTPAIMGEILYKKVFATCLSDTPPQLPDIPYNLQKAFNEQSLIGWDQLICGQLAYTWVVIIANYFYKRKCKDIDITALTWCRKFVRLMYDLVLKTWDQRNEEGHFSTKRHDSKLTRAQLMAKQCNLPIRIYNIKIGYLFFDQWRL